MSKKNKAVSAAPKTPLMRTAEPYLWIAPSIILMSIFIIIPIFYVFKMSMSKITKAGLIKGFAPLQCCHFASAVSAIKCTGVGARESVPTMETTKQFLEEKGYEL